MKNRIEDYGLSYSFSGIYRGVVEDNNDPEKKMRCRIRVFGLHTAKYDKTDGEGIPVDELIWAEPAVPITGGGASGFGTFGVPLQGTQVFLFFEGGNFLQPRFFAWSPTTTITPTAATVAAAKGAEESRKASIDNIKQNWDSAPTDIPASCRPEVAGAVARKFETSCRQPGFVSSGKGDKGGPSYGVYQFASTTGGVEEFYRNGMTAEDRKYFDGINPRDWTNANGKCAQAWKKWCAENEDAAFNAQQNYMMSKYYPQAASAFKAQTGIDPSSNRALQEAVISTSIQHGPSGASRIFSSSLNSSMNNEEMITAIYKNRSNVESTFKSSPSLWGGLRQRLGCDEPKLVLSMLGDESVPKSSEEAASKLAPTVSESQTQILKDNITEKLENPKPSTEGFTDKDGVHPQPNRNDQPAVHRVVRGETGDTATCWRNKNLEKKIPNVKGKTWNENEAQAAPEYPHNIVIAGKNGVMVEMDSTKGAEGYRVSHPSNSYQEFGANGNILSRANNDRIEISKVNKNTLIGGNNVQTTMGSSNEKINGDHVKEVMNENYKIFNKCEHYIGNTKMLTIGRDYKINILGKMDTKILGNNVIMCSSDKLEAYAGNIITTASSISTIAGSVRINAGMIYLN